MRPAIILFALLWTFTSAIEINLEEVKLDNVIESEKILNKRQAVVQAELINDFAGSRYNCPNNYRLVGQECHHVDCIFENTGQAELVCVVPATVVMPQPQCQMGYNLVDGRCVKIITEVVCPPNTVMENNECVFRLALPTVMFDFYCPPGSSKDVYNKKCIVSPQIATAAVECPIGYQRSGDTCYYQLRDLAIRCPDGSLPINGYCTVQIPSGQIRVECPYNSRSIGNNVCELLPLDYTVQCADGSMPDTLNRCHVYGNLTTTVTQCPPNSIERGGKCYVQAVIRYPLPEVVFECPMNFRRQGNVCVMEIHDIVNVVFQCPPNTYRQGDACLYRIDHPDKYNVKINCPSEAYNRGNACYFEYKEDDIKCERIVQSSKCCKRKKCGKASVATSIHNINYVYVPTNITSTNINTINIGQGSGNRTETKACEQKEEVYVDNKSEKCCTVVTPRVCEHQDDEWVCGHRNYERCGSMCSRDVIHLKASRPTYTNNMLVMPPPQYGMRVNRRHDSRVNCYGCLNGRYDCSPDCFEYDCANDGCNLIDQNSFCGMYGGEGCAPDDGYFQ